MIEVKILIDDFNYEEAVDLYLPIAAQKLSEREDTGVFSKMVSKNSGISTKVAKAALTVLPQDKKDEIAVTIIEKYKDELAANLVKFAAEKNLSFKLKEMKVSNID